METFPVGDGSGAVPDEFDPAAAAVWADEAVPTADLDGDGILDTVVADSAATEVGIFAGEGLLVATDTDLDGYTDRLTAIEDDGEYGVWELHRELDGTTRWTRVDQGNLSDVDHERTGE